MGNSYDAGSKELVTVLIVDLFQLSIASSV